MMNADDWLYLLFFLGDKLSRPTLRNLCESSEQFERRYQAAFNRWEQQGWVNQGGKVEDFVYALTDRGRAMVAPRRDPAVEWSREWDGSWRMLLFDLPSSETSLRMMLWRWLRGHQFGYLQNSVWVFPHSVSHLIRSLEWFRDNPEQFVLAESKTLFGASPASIVLGSWHWEEINHRYADYLEEVDSYESGIARDRTLEQLIELVALEREAYDIALAMDPLLPKSLIPSRYLGQRAHARRAAYRKKLSKAILSKR